ncbi:hypothetical protein F383_28214 [Gossypium arboreum]|uniref:Uncharacterized protein n=1 Tax=Gossypium arboreum TaxID=29729 RepID=A0A0B0PC62_GOSAR|nr:hypothetical protein F383_28214 [Gossypium arboreum]
MNWFIIVICDKFICIWLTKLSKAYFVCDFNFFLDIEAIGSSGIIKDHCYTIERYFGTFDVVNINVWHV